MGDITHEPDSEGAARHAGVIAEEYDIAREYGRMSGPAERRRAFAVLFISLVCMGAGQSVIYTILPPAARTLDMDAFKVFCIFAVSALIWVFSSTYWGARSDRWGRKPVMLLGLVAFSISFLAFATTMLGGLKHWLPIAFVFPLLIASRCIYGAFGSGTSAAAQAYVADRTTPKERLSGVAIISMAFALGTTFGPIIGSALTFVGLLAPFYFISALALASAAAVYLLLPERTPPKLHRPQVTTLRWHERRMFPFIAFGLVLSLIASIPVQTVSFFAMDVLKQSPHVSARFAGIGLTVSALAALFAQFVIVQRSGLSSRIQTSIGLVVAALSNALFLVTDVGHHLLVLVALALSGIGFGMARPGFTSGASLSVAPHEQGAVAGLLNAAGAAGFIFGPLIGWFYDLSPYVPYVFGTAMMLALLAAQYLSPVLRHAGDIPPDIAAAEETAETPLPGT
jgi:MFS family permease